MQLYPLALYSTDEGHILQGLCKVLYSTPATRNSFQEHDLYLRPEKCNFYQTDTEYLGFIVSHNKIEMDPVKTAAIAAWKTPTNLKETQSFLGFANFYRRFIPAFSTIA